MGKIQVLPDTLINQIAAGEVVERPASIVKELIENSLDAGATQIFVEVEQGGGKLISIRDNGSGMTAEDAELACARHATSKIKNLDDLLSIESFGFRGEALASIASVAQLTLRTRTHESEIGFEIEIHGGKEVAKKSVGVQPGTEIIVKNIFFNTPARKKFLKQEVTEAAHIAGVVTRMSLANPKVGFELISNGKKILNVPANSSEIERLAAVLSKDFVTDAIPVEFKTTSIHIRGFVSKPGRAAASKKHQYLFINGRDVSDTMISRAVFDAFGDRIPPRMYPSFVLNIDISPREVDVNVHPRKLTVKFVDQNQMYRDCRQAVSQAISQFQENLFEKDTQFLSNKLISTTTLSAGNDPAQYAQSTAQLFDSAPTKNPEGIIAHELPFQILGQIADSYILIFKEDGLAIVDQHAAHERILYEKILARRESANDSKKEISAQPLLVPISIECTPQQSIFLKDAVEFLSSIGFEIDFWSGSTVSIQSCPADLSTENLTTIFKKFLDEMLEDDGARGKARIQPDRILKSLACKGAIKFGMKIDTLEQRTLLKDLQTTPNNATCPHGRPVQILLTFDELERRFYRKK